VLTLSNGERFVASDVIVATGLANFARIPAVLSAPPGSLTIHSSAVEDFATFRGLEVAVVGAGQSALEAAALLHEAGASARLLIRKPEIRWMTQGRRKRKLWDRLRSPISALGSGPRAWALTQAPPLIHYLPDCWRAHILKTYLPPEGAWWLRERVDGLVPVHTETTVLDSRETGNRVALSLRSRDEKKDRKLTVDRVIAGTGYEVSVERISFLHPMLRRLIARHGSAPRLDGSFQSSVPGLRFVGPASAMSFGPLYRFVAGTDYTARTIANHLASSRGALA
jgi:hypothetical protein